MIVLDGSHERWEAPGETGVAVGVFDGVHLGHRQVLSLLVARCEAVGLVPTVLTFDPHPLRVLAPHREPLRLTTLGHRIELLEAVGIEAVAVLGFDEQIRDMEAEDFATDILAGRLRARVVAAGADFRFGAGRRGDVAMLGQMADRFEMLASPLLGEGEGLSSTRIRAAIAEGDVATASALLGRPHTVVGLPQGEERVDGVVVTGVGAPGMAVPHGGAFSGAVAGASVGIRPVVGQMTVVSAEPLVGGRVEFHRRIADPPTAPAALLEVAQRPS